MQLLSDCFSLKGLISHFNSKCVLSTCQSAPGSSSMTHLSLFFKDEKPPSAEFGRVCTQANSAQADVPDRRYCALSAASRTRLSDLNTASLASPRRVAASGAVEEPGPWTATRPRSGCLRSGAAAPGHTSQLPVGGQARALGDLRRTIQSWELFSMLLV